MHENPDRLVSALHDSSRAVDHEIRNLQSLLGVEPDGIIGPLTRAAAAKKGGDDAVSNRDLLTAIQNLEKNMNARTQAELDQITAIRTVVEGIAAADNGMKTRIAELETALAEARANAANPADFDAVDAKLTDLKDFANSVLPAVVDNTPSNL